jgi:hypothetical protein
VGVCKLLGISVVEAVGQFVAKIRGSDMLRWPDSYTEQIEPQKLVEVAYMFHFEAGQVDVII